MTSPNRKKLGKTKRTASVFGGCVPRCEKMQWYWHLTTNINKTGKHATCHKYCTSRPNYAMGQRPSDREVTLSKVSFPSIQRRKHGSTQERTATHKKKFLYVHTHAREKTCLTAKSPLTTVQSKFQARKKHQGKYIENKRQLSFRNNGKGSHV